MTFDDEADAAEEVGLVFFNGNRLVVEDGVVAGGTGQFDENWSLNEMEDIYRVAEITQQ